MKRRPSSSVGVAVSLSALDLFANALGALAFLLLLFAVNTIELARLGPLTILTRRLPESRAGIEYVGLLAASGGASPYQWTIISGDIPDGLRLDPECGEIVGVPAGTTAGRTYPLEIGVTDRRGKSIAASLSLRVLEPLSPAEAAAVWSPLVLLTHGSVPQAQLNRPYQLYLSARGGSGRYRWSVGGLPQGFSVDPDTGLLSGKPTKQGQFELTLRVVDRLRGRGDAGRAVAVVTLTVKEAGVATTSAPVRRPKAVILTTRLPAAIVAEPYEVTLAGTGVDPLSWSAKGLPAGLDVSANGVLTGRARSPGSYRTVLSMRDASGAFAADRTVELTVKPKPVSALERLYRRGIWGWVGHVLLILALVAVLYLLRRWRSARTLEMLAAHNVGLVHRPDRTTALNGEPDNVEAFQRDYRPFDQKLKYCKYISYAVLAVGLIIYTLWLLR